MPLIYIKHMTPKWLASNRNRDIYWNVDGVRDLNNHLFIPEDSVDYERIFTVDLIDPDVTRATDVMLFKVLASLEHQDPIIESRPNPPPRILDPLSIMISDGERAVGIQIQDPEDYDNIGPYIGIEGLTGNILTSITRHESQMEQLDKIPNTERRRWPQFFEVIIRVNNKRGFEECSGSCISSVRGGTSITSGFARTLNSTGPWRLELYRGERNENYYLNFLDVSIYVENNLMQTRTW